MTNRITYHCPHCGGQDCGWDAYAVWDDAAQMMALGGAYDGMWCSDCGELKSLDLVPLAEQPVLTRPMLLKVLDLSTGHVTKEVMDRLYDPQGNWPFSVKIDPYGCFLSVPDVDTDPADLPPSLAQCFQYVHSSGAAYIHFDRDAHRDETLPWPQVRDFKTAIGVVTSPTLTTISATRYCTTTTMAGSRTSCPAGIISVSTLSASNPVR